MRRHLPGTFTAHHLANGTWRLSRIEPKPADVFIRGADAAAADVFRLRDISDIDIEWRTDAVVMVLSSAGHSRTVGMHSALVHEPLEHLYDALPLAAPDADARRFWGRVFRLVRIPGGRHLLRILAHRKRNRR